MSMRVAWDRVNLASLIIVEVEESTGITAIEMADGQPPYISSPQPHVMFYIQKNPSPTLHQKKAWSNEFNAIAFAKDFTAAS